MLIELKWLDHNKGNSYETQIYRSTAPFENIDEANLIVTIPAGVRQYLDTDVIQGIVYYYRFRIKRGNTYSPVSKQYNFEANPYNGPGATRVVFGDERFGYYGKFPDNDLAVPSLNYLRNLFGLSLLPIEFQDYPHKFAIGGSVRGTYSYPLALGTELSRSHPYMQIMLSGQPVKITLGLHDWVLIIPSAIHTQNIEHEIEHFPGELRSMLGVITELYARVEDADTGNTTGDHLTDSNGMVNFYEPLTQRYPTTEVKWICSCDWEEDMGEVIDWTSTNPTPPIRPKELHVNQVDFGVPGNWEKTLIWPVLVYSGLTGPQ